MTDQFALWLSNNRHIYNAFVELALRTKQNSRKRRWSADAIFHVLRWETAMRQQGDTEFKLNNNYTAPVARLAMAENPELDGFFQLRECSQ